MKQKRTSQALSCILIAVLLVCGGAALALGSSAWLAGKARQMYGPPATRLGLLERTWLSAQLVLWMEPALTGPAQLLSEPISFQVEPGESAGSIAYRLEASGLILDGNAFRTYLIYSGIDTLIQAGDYELQPNVAPLEIAAELQDATPGEVTFGVLPGWRLEEIAGALATSGLSFSASEFLELASLHPGGYSFSALLPAEGTLEGFFLPGEYRFAREVAPSEFIHTFLTRFDEQMSPEIEDGFSEQGLDLYQAVTLASIVEREAVRVEEQPQIASVFFNRLAAGMRLESDPTVQYAAGYQADLNIWWVNPVRVSDLQIDSPYNTYLYAGLPPGPIANPGLPALRAVAFPAQTPYYYFRAACDGSGLHLFAETYEQHLANACP